MIRIERKIGWYAALAVPFAPAWLLMGSSGFAPAAWVLGLAWAWFVAWLIMKRYEKRYRNAIDVTLSNMITLVKDKMDVTDTRRLPLLIFIDRTRDNISSGWPLMKMNRWVGNIEGKLVAYGLVSDGELGDMTRPLFRPLDYGS